MKRQEPLLTHFKMSLENENRVLFDITIADEKDIDLILNAIISLASGEMANGIFELLIKHPLFGDLLIDKFMNLELDLKKNDSSGPAILPSQTIL